MKNLDIHIGEIITDVMKTQNITKAELARRLDVKPQSVDYLLGRSSIDTNTLYNVSEALDIRTVRDFFAVSAEYGSSKNFNKCINEGISDITRKNDLPHISVYSFRHSWATFAQNDFDASLDLVGFCLKHASSHRVTSGYVKTDFSVIDRLNAKILDYVFEEKNEKRWK